MKCWLDPCKLLAWWLGNGLPPLPDKALLFTELPPEKPERLRLSLEVRGLFDLELEPPFRWVKDADMSAKFAARFFYADRDWWEERAELLLLPCLEQLGEREALLLLWYWGPRIRQIWSSNH